MILIFKRTVQIAIKNIAVFVLLLVNISFKFWWYFFQMISFQHLTVCKVRQLEELCGDCLNIWGLVVFSFNFHESSRWHVLHQEHIVFCNGKSDFLFFFALWRFVGVDSYGRFDIWKPVALLLRLVDLEGIQRSIWDEPKIRRCVRESCLQTRLKKGFTN